MHQLVQQLLLCLDRTWTVLDLLLVVLLRLQLLCQHPLLLVHVL
jgi:hypothetical protein